MERNTSGMVFPIRRMSTRKQAKKTGSEGKLLTKLHVNLYKVSKGLYPTFVHVGRCMNGDKEEAWNRLIASGEPKSICELNALLRALFGMPGCEGCHVDKTTVAGLLFNHSQDDLFSVGSTPSDGDSYVSMVTASDISGSWPASEIISQLPLSEQRRYGSKFKMDNSSNSDYVPPRAVRTAMKMGSAQDVPMTMEGGTDTENKGLGNSKWVESSSSVELPETVSYTQSESQNELMMEELDKINNGEAVPVVEELDTVMVGEVAQESNVQQQPDEEIMARISRMEKVIMGMRDEIDELRDFKEITETEGCKFCIKNGGRKELTSNRNTVVLAIPIRIPGIPIPVRPKTMGSSSAQRKTIQKREVSTTPMEDNALVEKPSYEKTAETFAQKAASGMDKKEFSIVTGRKRFQKKEKKEVVEGIKVREKHLKIRFDTTKGTVMRLPRGVSQASIRDGLNECLRNLNERKIYFSMVGQNRFGDVLLTLADSRADDVLPYIKGMEGRLETMGLPKFRFEKDTEKAKIFFGSVPLNQAGKGS